MRKQAGERREGGGSVAKGDRKVQDYVDAKREVDALESQLEALNGDDRSFWLEHWGGDLAQARVAAKLAYGALKGGELARARARLAQEVTE